MSNKKGFAITSLLYPAFIIILTITVLILITLIQTSFSINKLTGEVKGDLTDNNTMKSLKDNATNIINDTKKDQTVYMAQDGKIYIVDSSGKKSTTALTFTENTTGWLGKIFTNADGTENLLIDNGKYCAFKVGSMSGVAVYNSGECNSKLADETGCTDAVALMNDPKTIQALQDRVDALKTRIQNIKTNNTQSKDFLKAHPVGSIYISLSATNPKDIYGGVWEKYSQGRMLIGAGSTTDSRNTSVSFNTIGATGGEYNQALVLENLPSHNHTITVAGTVSGTCNVSGSTNTAENHNHYQDQHRHAMNSATVINDGNNYTTRMYSSTGFYAGADYADYPTSSATPQIYANGDHSHTFSGTVNINATFSGQLSTTSSVGSNAQFNIQNPYVVVYIWHRTS